MWIILIHYQKGETEYITKKHDFIQFLRFIIAPHLSLNEIKISANFWETKNGATIE